MSPTLTSQGLVFATAMAVSAATVILFDLFRQNLFSPDENPPLKPCLSSGGKKESKKKKRKRVKFADDVKDSEGNGELYRKGNRKSAGIESGGCCGNEMFGSVKMPANRAALYSGILRDRVHRMEYSY